MCRPSTPGYVQAPNHSLARASLQLKFLLELEVELSNGGTQIYAAHLVWRFDPAAVAAQLTEDWGRLESHPLVFSRATRDTSGAKGARRVVEGALQGARSLFGRGSIQVEPSEARGREAEAIEDGIARVSESQNE